MARKRAAKLPAPAIIVKGTFGPPETPAQRTARLQQQALDAAHRRRVEWAVLTATLIITVAALIIAIVLLAAGNTEARSWAMTMVGTIVAGYLAFWSGSQTKK
jgi:hypothetical protein